MSGKAGVFKVSLSLADLDAMRFDCQRFTTAFLPLETTEHLVLRLLAKGIGGKKCQFSPRCANADRPDLYVFDQQQDYWLWMEVGAPDAAHLRAIRRRAPHLLLLTTHTQLLDEQLRELDSIDNLEVLAVSPHFVGELEAHLSRQIDWSILVQEGILTLSSDDFSLQSPLESMVERRSHTFESLLA